MAELISILQVFQGQFNVTIYKNQNKQIVSLTKDQHDQGIFDIKITHPPTTFWLTDCLIL